MEPSCVRQPGSGSPRWSGGPGSGYLAGDLSVLLSKRAVVLQVFCLYGAISGVVLALIFLAGDVGMWAAFGLLALALPYVFLGAALLYEQRPVIIVSPSTGVTIRHAALLGEKFTPCGPVVCLPWEEIDGWEVSRLRLPLGLPTCASVLKLYLRDADAFMRSQGSPCGWIRFLWKGCAFGTPLVVSDMVLQESAQTIGEFMNAARGRQNRRLVASRVPDPDPGARPEVPVVVVQQ